MNSTKVTLLFQLALAVFLSLAGPIQSAAQEESIVLDPDTRDYIITYRSTYDPNKFETVVFVPATKIDPTVKSKFKQTESGTIKYRYKVKNGKNGRQPLIGVRFLATSADNTSQVTPNGWRGLIVSNIGGVGVRVNWSYRDLKEHTLNGLKPGRSQNGFSVDSKDLPGIGMIELNGDTPLQGFPDEGPDFRSEVGKKLVVLESNDFVPLNAAVPRIPIPDPFDAAAVLTSIQKHVKVDLVIMGQIDSVFASQLDRLFDTAITAVNQGNLVAARSDIKALKQLLHEEHEELNKEDDDDEAHDKDKTGLITKLAAKVLVFDLKYIEKQLKGKYDD